MRFAQNIATLVTAAFLTVPASVRAEGLADLVPADAKAVVLINDLEKFVAGSTKFTQAANIPAPPADLSQMTQILGNLGSAWKLNRGVALVVLEPTQDGCAVIFPVDDAAAALTTVNAQMEGEFGKFEISGQPVYGLRKGKFLVVGNSAATLKPFQATTKSLSGVLTTTQTELSTAGNAFVYVNVQALKPLIDQGVSSTEHIKEILSKIPQRGPIPMDADKVAPMIQKALKALSEQTSSFFGSFGVSGEGVTAQFGAELLQGSPARAKLANYQAANSDLFAHAPASNFIAAMGIDFTALASLGDKTMADVDVGNFNMSLGLDKDALVLAGKATTKNAAALNEKLKGLLGVGLMAVGATGKATVANSDKNVGGVAVNEAAFKFPALAADQAAKMAAIFGSSDVFLQTGVVGDAVGFAVSGRPDAFTALQSAGSLGQQETVKTALGHLPRNAVMTVLIDPLTGLRLGKKIAAVTKAESPLASASIPEQQGVPIGFALTIDKEGVIGHAAIPSATIKELMPLLSNLH